LLHLLPAFQSPGFLGAKALKNLWPTPLRAMGSNFSTIYFVLKMSQKVIKGLKQEVLDSFQHQSCIHKSPAIFMTAKRYRDSNFYQPPPRFCSKSPARHLFWALLSSQLPQSVSVFYLDTKTYIRPSNLRPRVTENTNFRFLPVVATKFFSQMVVHKDDEMKYLKFEGWKQLIRGQIWINFCHIFWKTWFCIQKAGKTGNLHGQNEFDICFWFFGGPEKTISLNNG
jgi:hypothetical protein